MTRERVKLVIVDVRDFKKSKRRERERRNLCQKWIGLSSHCRRRLKEALGRAFTYKTKEIVT